MSIKTILVALNEIDQVDKLVKTAAQLGRKYQAHIIGMFVIPAPEIYPSAGMALSTQVYDGHRRFYLDHSEKVKAKFEDEMRRQNVLHEWCMVEIKTSLIADGVLHHAHQVDLILAPQKQENSSAGMENDFTERLVMEGGRPVLIMPAFGEFEDIGKEVLVGWNGTKEAARAVFDALPFMIDANNVTIGWVNPKDDLEDGEVLPGSELAASLARHDIKTTSKGLPTDGVSVGEALLNQASDSGADLLVMGAYGHSRIREFVFGGATHSILETMTVPVLMSH